LNFLETFGSATRRQSQQCLQGCYAESEDCSEDCESVQTSCKLTCSEIESTCNQQCEEIEENEEEAGGVVVEGDTQTSSTKTEWYLIIFGIVLGLLVMFCCCLFLIWFMRNRDKRAVTVSPKLPAEQAPMVSNPQYIPGVEGFCKPEQNEFYKLDPNEFCKSEPNIRYVSVYGGGCQSGLVYP